MRERDNILFADIIIIERKNGTQIKVIAQEMEGKRECNQDALASVKRRTRCCLVLCDSARCV